MEEEAQRQGCWLGLSCRSAVGVRRGREGRAEDRQGQVSHGRRQGGVWDGLGGGRAADIQDMEARGRPRRDR